MPDVKQKTDSERLKDAIRELGQVWRDIERQMRLLEKSRAELDAVLSQS